MPAQNVFWVKYFTKDDYRTPIADQLVDQDGVPIPLSGSTVTFRMTFQTTLVIKVANGAAAITDLTNAYVSYSWTTGDLDTVGTFHYWWIVNTSGLVEHFPGDGEKRRLIVVAKE